MSDAQTAHAAMSDARIAQAEARAKSILAEMNHTRTRCDDCDMIDPPTDDSGCHDECPSAGVSARLWRAMVARDGTKLEGIEGLREIASLMIDLVGDVRRSRELAASYDMDHALRDAAEQAELLQHGAERARDEARAEAHRLRARVAEMEAIITGRTTPPTDAEIVAHSQAHRPGLWVTRDAEGNVVVECGPRSLADLRREHEMDGGGVRWISLDTAGRPCAWPTTAEGAR